MSSVLWSCKKCFLFALAIVLYSAIPLHAAQVSLTWGTVTNAEGYRVFRRAEGGAYNYTTPVYAGSGTTCTVANLTDDTLYYFVARAYTGSIQSSNSNEVSFRFVPPAPAPNFTIKASAGPNGSISPSGTSSVNPGSSINYTIKPATGYQIADVKVNGASAGAVASYTFSQVSGNHTIEASFVVSSFTITATAGANGSITPSGTAKVVYGGSSSYAIAPAAGYRIADVKVDGVSRGAVTSYTFSQIAANHSIAASFEATGTTITATASTGGGISPAGVVKVSHGGSQSFSISCQSGYQIADVRVDGASIGAAASFTFTQVTANHSIAADFKSVDPEQKLIIDDGDPGTTPGGMWSISNGSSAYGTQSLYSKQVGAEYAYEAPLSGRYEVGLWWSAYSSRCTNVPVEIYDGDMLLDTVSVDQRQNGGKWNSLGTHDFSGRARVVVVSENSGCSTCSDAVSFAVEAPKIIDDGQPGTYAIGNWQVSGGAQPYGTQSLYSKRAGDTYAFETPLNGSVEVALWWSAYSSRCSRVPVEIYNGSTLVKTVYVDQRQNGGTWNVLGTFQFSGQGRVVVVSESASCSTSADAVKFSHHGRKVIDNGSTGTSGMGTWRLSGGADSFGADSIYSKQVGAEYAFEAPQTGNYEVALWWSAYSSRCTNVPVRIYDGNSLVSTVYINQSQNGGQWNNLGRYDFTGQAKVVVVSTSSQCSTCADALSLMK